MRVRFGLLPMFLLLAALPLNAQRAVAPLAAGDRVRVSLSNASTVVGRVGGWAGDSLSIVDDRGAARTTARSELVRIERWSRPHNERVRRAALWVGVPFGVLGGLACAGFTGGDPLCIAVGAAYGLVGGSVGAIIGFMVRGGGWDTVALQDWGAPAR